AHGGLGLLVGNLVRARAEEEGEQSRSFVRLEGDEALEQALEIGEEPGLALLHAHDRRVAVRRHVGDPAAACSRNLVLDVVRDVEDGEVRQRRGDRDRNLYRRHAVTSRGRRKCTSSRATVTSSSSSQPWSASRASVAATSSSGVEAPAVRPIVWWPSSSARSSSFSPLMSSAAAPALRATSTRRCAFELVCDPITRIRLASSASRLTASWRFWVA